MLARTANLLFAAAGNVARNGAAYAIAAASLVLALTLLLSAEAIRAGLAREELESVRSGASVCCSGELFGREAPLPAALVDALARIDGVVDVVPRIIGRVPVGDRQALVVGLPLARLASHPIAVDGELPKSEAQVLVGCELAHAVGLAPGMRLGLDAESLRLFTISGVIDESASLWSANAVFCDLAEAAIVFGESAHVSDVCLETRTDRPSEVQRVAAAARGLDPHLRVRTRAGVDRLLADSLQPRAGAFTVLFALALALALAAFAIVCYVGRTPRRREIAVLKSEGWTTGDVLALVAFENLLVGALAAGLSLLAAQVWVSALRAPLIAPLLLPDLPLFPRIIVPALFTPLPALLALGSSVAILCTGSLVATWRTARTRPADVLR